MRGRRRYGKRKVGGVNGVKIDVEFICKYTYMQLAFSVIYSVFHSSKWRLK